MHSAKPDEFDVERGRLRQMDRNVGLVPRYVGRAHRALEIDKNIRERLLEIDEARGQPECSQSLGDGDPDFARERIGDGIAGAQQIERRRLHAFDRRNNQRSFVGQAGAMDVARKQGGADLPLEIIDPPANDVDRQVKPLGRGSEASATHDLQKYPGRVPIRETAESDLVAFLLRNAPFQRQTHT